MTVKVSLILVVRELSYLVDNGAFVPKKTIMNIIDNGYDFIQYLDITLNYKMDWSFLIKNERDLFMETVIVYYENHSDKHWKIENNGLLLLIDICMNIIAMKYYDDIEIANLFFGNLSDKQIWALKDGQMITNHDKYPER